MFSEITNIEQKMLEKPTVRAPTLLQLQCFVELVQAGSFAAAAYKLHRTHPTVHAAVKSLEELLGLTLLDRSTYRVTLTPEGASFYEKSRLFLRQFAQLQSVATSLARGVEHELRVVVGDLCPLADTLAHLRRFFSEHAGTRLILMVESIGGPWERLREGGCDLIFHHQEQPSFEFEAIPMFDVALIPVAAPGFVEDAQSAELQERMQCVIRDSSRTPERYQYHVIEGAPRCSVPDQNSKRELIVQGLAWGHMPKHMVEADLVSGRLVSLQGQSLPGAVLPHYAMRRRDAVHGPVAQQLWRSLGQLGA